MINRKRCALSRKNPPEAPLDTRSVDYERALKKRGEELVEITALVGRITAPAAAVCFAGAE